MEVLRYGSEGNGVLLAQLALKRAGYYKGEFDGVFGTRTLNAVRRLQTAEGLAPDGVYGKKTAERAEPFLLGARQVSVRPGDTLYKLARRYGTSLAAVETANPGVDPKRLMPGQTVTVPLGFELVPRGIPFSSALAEYVIRGLALRYPFIAVGSIGASVLGRPIRTLTMGEGSKSVFISAAYHANEWITAPLIMSFIERYAMAFSAGGSICGADARELYGKAGLYAAPMVNPDGVDLVTGAFAPASPEYRAAAAIAEDYPEIPFPEGWKANIAGTDINLNFPADWEAARGIKYAAGFTRPAPRDYVGSEPLSAPEARAVAGFTVKKEFDAVLAFHTQGEVIYWRYGELEPKGGYEIGTRLAHASGYKLDDVPEFSSCAGYRDWFIQEYGRPGYTVEAGKGVNPLPTAQFDEIASACFPLIAEAMRAISE